MTIDGNKQKHDLQRVCPDGRGSYDDVLRIEDVWKQMLAISSDGRYYPCIRLMDFCINGESKGMSVGCIDGPYTVRLSGTHIIAEQSSTCIVNVSEAHIKELPSYIFELASHYQRINVNKSGSLVWCEKQCVILWRRSNSGIVKREQCVRMEASIHCCCPFIS
jgi:hypothetical protein